MIRKSSSGDARCGATRWCVSRQDVRPVGEIHVAHEVVGVSRISVDSNQREIIPQTQIYAQLIRDFPLIHGVKAVNPTTVLGLDHISACRLIRNPEEK